jgi:hypothetical protein
MQSIVLVCRSWSDVGVTFLYENVCIRRCHQLELLQRTLTNASIKLLNSLVKSLTIQCYIPEDREFGFRANLDDVVGCCPALSTFAYSTGFVPPASALLINFPAYITHFRLEGHFHYDILPLILQQLKQTLLSFHLMSWEKHFLYGGSPVFLPSLHSLSVAFLGYRNVDVLDILRTHWVMPSLRSLTIVKHEYYQYVTVQCDEQLQTAIISFLACNGGQLRQLHIGLECFQFHPESFKQLLHFCPQLERLILHPSTFLRSHWTESNAFFHPNLRWIDFTHHLRDKDIYLSSELCLSEEYVPALECVRRFCNLHRGLHIWLDEYTPSEEDKTTGSVIDVFQHQLDCHEGLIAWRFERDVRGDADGGVLSGSFTVWEDTDSDDSYVPSEDEEDDSSSEELDFECTTDDEEF